MGFTLDALIKTITAKQAEIVTELQNRNIKHAVQLADETARLIYHFEKLSEELPVTENQ